MFVSGSNPNTDYNITTTYPTEYRVETFYPSYFNERRPEPQGLPNNLSYGGNFFNVTLSKDDLFGDVQNVKNAMVVIIRTGFSTHTLVSGGPDFSRTRLTSRDRTWVNGWSNWIPRIPETATGVLFYTSASSLQIPPS